MRVLILVLTLSLMAIPFVSSPQTAGASPPESWAQVQESLIWTGFYSGPIDGQLGIGSREAVKKYQKANGEPANGNLSAALRGRLLERAVQIKRDAGFDISIDSATGILIGLPKSMIAGPFPRRHGSDYSDPKRDFHIGLRYYPTSLTLQQIYEQLKESLSTAKVDYAVMRPDWLVLAGSIGDYEYYMRYYKQGNALAGFYSAYKRSRAETFSPATIMASLTLRAFVSAPAPQITGADAGKLIPLEPPLADFLAENAKPISTQIAPGLGGPYVPVRPSAEPRTTSNDEFTKNDALLENVKAYLAKYPEAKFYRYIIKKEDLPGFSSDMPLLRVVFDQRVFFDTALSDIKPEADDTLNRVAAALRKLPTETALFVAGHTDSRGGDDYNLDLSMQRAYSAARGLLNRGVGLAAVWRVGFGKTIPLRKNDTDENMALNRRVEFLIASKPAVGAAFLARQPDILCATDLLVDCTTLRANTQKFVALPVTPGEIPAPALPGPKSPTLGPLQPQQVGIQKREVIEIDIGAKTYTVGPPRR